MSFDDFCNHFEEVSLCQLGPDFDSDGKVDHVGEVCIFMSYLEASESKWVNPVLSSIGVNSLRLGGLHLSIVVFCLKIEKP